MRTLGRVNLSRQIGIKGAAEYRMVVNGVVLIWGVPLILHLMADKDNCN